MTLTLPVGAPGRPRGEAARWTASLAVVVALHGLGAAALLEWHGAVEPIALPPPAAIMIDLAPLPAPPIVEPPRQVMPEPLPSPAPKPEVMLPAPKPKVVHKVAPPPPPPTPAVEPTPAAPTPPAPAQQAVAPNAAVPAPSTVTPSYLGQLAALLRQHQRYPREALLRRQEGAPVLHITLARDGTLLAFKLVRSAGYPALDAEVLALIRRVAPLPPFPADMPGATLELDVPIRFRLTN